MFDVPQTKYKKKRGITEFSECFYSQCLHKGSGATFIFICVLISHTTIWIMMNIGLLLTFFTTWSKRCSLTVTSQPRKMDRGQPNSKIWFFSCFKAAWYLTVLPTEWIELIRPVCHDAFISLDWARAGIKVWKALEKWFWHSPAIQAGLSTALNSVVG